MKSPWYGWRPAAFVFDCDGLLVDTEPSWERAEGTLFARRGLNFTDQERANYLGVCVSDTAVLMAARFDEPGQEAALVQELLTEVFALLEHEAKPMPGAVELIERLVVAEMPIAVASNSPDPIVQLALEVAGMAGAFQVVVTADEAIQPKPDPEPYLLACAELGVEPRNSVALEDSFTGLTAAQAAGMRTLAVPTRPDSLVSEWVLPSLTHFELDQWLRSWL